MNKGMNETVAGALYGN